MTALLEAEGGHCAICFQPATAVDHDHHTGKVRGLLCKHCNVGLGMFADDPERLENAILYLSRSKPKPKAPRVYDIILG